MKATEQVVNIINKSSNVATVATKTSTKSMAADLGIEFLNATDELLASSSVGDKGKIHLRVQNRSGRKKITIVEGLDESFDLKRICKAMRQAFSCNGSVEEDAEERQVLQLQGDQRQNVKEWLLEQEIVGKSDKDRIVVHGA